MKKPIIKVDLDKYWIMKVKNSETLVAFDKNPDDAFRKLTASEMGEIPDTDTIDGYPLVYDTIQEAYILPTNMTKIPVVINAMYPVFISYTKW